jgi:hypothetical protein
MRRKNRSHWSGGGGATDGETPEKQKEKRRSGPREEVVVGLFNMLDADGNGFLRISELNFLGMRHADLFIGLCDQNLDNRISKSEFCDWTFANIVLHLSDDDVQRTSKLCRISRAGRSFRDPEIPVMFDALDIDGGGGTGMLSTVGLRAVLVSVFASFVRTCAFG